jgi:hypothetical protein
MTSGWPWAWWSDLHQDWLVSVLYIQFALTDQLLYLQTHSFSIYVLYPTTPTEYHSTRLHWTPSTRDRNPDRIRITLLYKHEIRGYTAKYQQNRNTDRNSSVSRRTTIRLYSTCLKSDLDLNTQTPHNNPLLLLRTSGTSSFSRSVLLYTSLSLTTIAIPISIPLSTRFHSIR